jgi:hypothetical protein
MISRATGNPTVAVYDTTQGSAWGMFVGGSSTLYFGQTDGNGNPQTALAWLNSSGEFGATQLYASNAIASPNLTATNQLVAAATFPAYPAAPSFQLYKTGNIIHIDYQSGYGLEFNTGTGYFTYNTPNGPMFQVDPSGNTEIAGYLGVYNAADPGGFRLGETGGSKYISFSTDVPPWELRWDGSTGNLGYYQAGGVELFQIAGASGNLFINGTGIIYNGIQANNSYGFYYSAPNYYIRLDGNGANDAVIGTLSDERLKENIAPTTFDCLAAVLASPLFEYRLRDDPDGDLIPIGFIAQRLHAAFPSAVRVGATLPDGDTGRWQIDPQSALAAAYGAIQQLAARVVALEART